MKTKLSYPDLSLSSICDSEILFTLTSHYQMLVKSFMSSLQVSFNKYVAKTVIEELILN